MKLKQLINLEGPDGNAFFLLAKAQELAAKLGKDGDEICERMQSDDYFMLLDVFMSEFSDYVLLLNRPIQHQ